ncbi:MAG: hypothetical protein LAT82_03900 [Nanoarchaeota archaeon]|nr:hypothetical protein [Nanoarchaeota archaeon]
MVSEEIRILENITKKLEGKFTNLLFTAFEEYEIEWKYELTEETSHHFIGWFFCEFVLLDGKMLPQLVKESIELEDKEKKLIENISNAILGYFEIVSQDSNVIKVKDILTQNEYEVFIIDLDYQFKSNDVIEAKLVKNFNDKLFFFGGFRVSSNGKKSIYESMNQYK